METPGDGVSIEGAPRGDSIPDTNVKPPVSVIEGDNPPTLGDVSSSEVEDEDQVESESQLEVEVHMFMDFDMGDVYTWSSDG